MTKEIYIFSGLGADERVFQRIDFYDSTTIYIKWIIPNKKETIEQYATRLIEQITTAKPTLVGLSFGGLMAIEVAKQMEVEKVILIASAKTKKEIPFYFRFAGTFGLHKFLPTKLLKSSHFLTNWFFGTTSTSDKQILKEVLHDTDGTFLKWAIDKITRWKNETLIKKTYHIHGTSDRIFPFMFVKCDMSVKKGGHLMTLNRAGELSAIMRKELTIE